MKPSQDNFPVFEMNQVLSSAHLNQVFDYLDEQERLTRADLIGIGIVCGLEIPLSQDPDGGLAVLLTKGCGVTSQGYLIVEPEDTPLTGYRQYSPPSDLPYPPFMKDENPYPLWELFPAGEPDTAPITTPAGFLSDKAVLLFLELKKEGLRNCGMNNCDDKGSEVSVRVRPLLIGINDLREIVAKANAIEDSLSVSELAEALLERLNLPELHLPRVDVPNTAPATSQEVYAAFQAVFTGEKLVQQTATALTAAYDAFKPLVKQKYPDNPFAGFTGRFGFLDHAPVTTAQVKFLQYYYDLFDDISRALHDLSRKGAELFALCCPPEMLFPRHLMLGVPFPNQVSNPELYRTPFWPSPALSGGEGRLLELEQLFARLVEMAARFSEAPPLPLSGFSRLPTADGTIRITPSRLGDGPLCGKAIPYYYLFSGDPPLYRLWDPEKTRRNQANRNLGYRSDSYQPPAPPFVTNALNYDLEPFNFLRIEGHLGKNYQGVMSTLLTLKSRYRLPIEVIALRTGAFDENVPVDVGKKGCRFQDLEALYETVKAESTCFLCLELQYFYSLPFESRSKITAPVKPQLALLAQCAPGFLVQPQTLGRLFEDYLANQPGGVVPEIDPNIIIDFLNSQNAGQTNLIIFYVIVYLVKLFEEFAPTLAELDYATFEKRYRDLMRVTEAVEKEREDAAGGIEGAVNLLRWEELDDRLEAILYQCRLDVIKALEGEYQDRLREVKQKLYLSAFLRDHPGIQHKAGVPLGGTFIVVYHEAPPRILAPGRGTDLGGLRNRLNVEGRIGTGRVTTATSPSGTTSLCAEVEPTAMMDAFDRIGARPEFAADPDIRMVLGAFTGRVPDPGVVRPPASGAADIIEQAVRELPDGTVIADFYLPYLCCSDCAPVQFALPTPPLGFTLQIGCTNANNQAEVTVTPEGGVAPYSVKVDQQDFHPLEGALALTAGPHTLSLRDQEGTVSAPQTIEVPQRLVLGEPRFDCIGDTGEYVALFQISGGTPPYSANRGTVNGTGYASGNLPVDTDIEIDITDARHCSAAVTLRHSCVRPLAFTAKPGCTGANGQAPVEIAVTGGTAPYQVQVDTAAPSPLTGPIQLAVGGHSVSVHDAAGAAAAPQTVVIAPQLVLRETDFTCEGTASFRSSIRIEGGTPPFTANNRQVTGNFFSTDPIPNGNSFSVTVTDHNNCSASIQVQHSCEQACDLPCGGESRRCAYRLWVQPPFQDARYESYRQEPAVRLRFNGRDITLRTDGLPVPDAGHLNENFDDAIGRYVKALNEVVNQALVEQAGAAQGRMILSYQPSGAYPFAALFIEYFACDSFNLEFRYSFARPNPAFSMMIRYSNEPDAAGATFDGAVFVNQRLNKETRVPSFDCSERNQCTHVDYHKLCDAPPPDLDMNLARVGDNGVALEGKVGNLQPDEVVAWVWDLPLANSSEPFYVGEKVEVQVQHVAGPVLLAAITRKGCIGGTRKDL
ncbi:hypothetical protein KP005_07210 [Geomonas nitrogeniifigens]|uniref:Uncharacterized protein n=1 Tax=Geomonas diazotrophica TaxID=2843197 RepID=A0ABX8JL10_9BACT|nr:hypothetical protein [Geomonas nitrogeniifigens]QWV99064.1 hypothetical protein KP005_07210 [Geomonas nitrogeniifigens]